MRTLTQPYDAMADAVQRRDWRTGIVVPLVIIVLLQAGALILPTDVPPATHWLAIGAGTLLFSATFFAAAGAVFFACRLVRGSPDWKGMLAAWGLTYVPTGGWFMIMLILHILIPDKHAALSVFQVILAILSLAFFLWKLLLYYFALRLAGQLSFRQIVNASIILAPIALAYWAVGYWLGIFEVPLI